MLNRGKIFYEKLIAARGKVAKVAANFITDGSVRKQVTKIINYLKVISYYYFLF